jgi:hypothetical protein
MKKSLSAVLLLVIILTSFSCKKFDKAQKKADEFYSFMKEGKYENAYDLISLEEFKNISKEDWVSVFDLREKAYGKVVSYDQTFSGVSNYGKGTIIELRFEVENEDGTTYEVLRFRKKDGEMKIIFYSYTDNPDFKTTASTDDDTEEDEDIESYPAQEKVAEEFYSLTKQGKIDELQTLLSKEAVEYTGEDAWNDLLSNKFEEFGKLKSYKLIDSYENKTEIILIYQVKYENFSKIYEKCVFNKEDEPERISFYQVNESLKELEE